MVCAAAMVPPEVGLVQAVAITKVTFDEFEFTVPLKYPAIINLEGICTGRSS